MHRGYFRLGIFLSVIWLVVVVAFVWYEFSSRNVFCQFDASTVADAACQHFFWSWVPVGKLAQFSPNTLRLLLVALSPLAVGWLLGFAINWVRKGFRPSAT
jgi:hypothetical protein